MPDTEANDIAYGDQVLFMGRDRKPFLRTLFPGEQLQTHDGVLRFDDLVGIPFGSIVQTHLKRDVLLLRPSTDDLILFLRRETQIIFPKDLGYILLKLGIRPGSRVIEAGTGSGGLTIVLAMMVGPTGHVYSYDRRSKPLALARHHLERLHLLDRVTLYERDVTEGFDERDAHALFLDLPDPWEYLNQAHDALRGGGIIGCTVPTINQLIRLNKALHSYRWFYIQIEELLLRQYKTLANRVRPDDRMVGHTGFLLFARRVFVSEGGDSQLFGEESEWGSDAADGEAG